VFLARGPEEPPDAELRGFYGRLLPAVAELRGDWRLLDTDHPALLAWAWDAHLIVVNLSAHEAQGLVTPPWPGAVTLDDRLSGARYERGTDLYVILPGWGVHFFGWTSA
jgi:hypothetical protein